MLLVAEYSAALQTSRLSVTSQVQADLEYNDHAKFSIKIVLCTVVRRNLVNEWSCGRV